MPSITLATPDIALFTNVSATRISIPHLVVQTRTRRYEQAVVRFEGDEQPTPFRGEGRPRLYTCTARFPHNKHDDYANLIDLFEDAQDAADPRLLLRTNGRLAESLNMIEVVTVDEVTETHIGGQAWDVQFAASTVAYTVAV